MMSNPIGWDSYVLNELFSLHKQKILCDLRIVGSDGGHVEVHSLLLAAVSPVILESVLAATRIKSTESLEITVPNAELQVLSRLVEFIYTGTLCTVNKNTNETQKSPKITSQDTALYNTAMGLKIQPLMELLQERNETAFESSVSNNRWRQNETRPDHAQYLRCSTNVKPQQLKEIQNSRELVHGYLSHTTPSDVSESISETKCNRQVDHNTASSVEDTVQDMSIQSSYLRQGFAPSVTYSSQTTAFTNLLETQTKITHDRTSSGAHGVSDFVFNATCDLALKTNVLQNAIPSFQQTSEENQLHRKTKSAKPNILSRSRTRSIGLSSPLKNIQSTVSANVIKHSGGNMQTATSEYSKLQSNKSNTLFKSSGPNVSVKNNESNVSVNTGGNRKILQNEYIAGYLDSSVMAQTTSESGFVKVNGHFSEAQNLSAPVTINETFKDFKSAGCDSVVSSVYTVGRHILTSSENTPIAQTNLEENAMHLENNIIPQVTTTAMHESHISHSSTDQIPSNGVTDMGDFDVVEVLVSSTVDANEGCLQRSMETSSATQSRGSLNEPDINDMQCQDNVSAITNATENYYDPVKSNTNATSDMDVSDENEPRIINERDQLKINPETEDHSSVPDNTGTNEKSAASLCILCNKQFQLRSSYVRHMKKHHPEQPLLPLSKITSGDVSSRVLRDQLGFHCKNCVFIGATVDLFKQHCVQTHNISSPFECSECVKSFASWDGLRRHSVIHRSICAYICAECGAQFKRNSGLFYHRKYKHGGNRSHHCNICQKTFVETQALKYHMKSHEESRDLKKCPVCEKTFASRTGLNRHVSTHAPSRDFECSPCGKRFFSSSDLKSHQRNVHNRAVSKT